MPVLSSNNIALLIDGVDVSGYWTDEIDFNRSNSSQEITRGAGVTHVQRAAGLSDTTMSFAVVYDTTNIALYRAKLVVGSVYTVIFGPEGNVSGKPKFECSMVLEEVAGPNNTIDKQKVMFELSFSGADAPTATIEGGSTF